MFRAALRVAGYDVEVAGDGVTALTAIERHCPDLIVLDLELPRLRGEAILDELAADARLQAIPIIVVTGSDAEPPRGHAVAVIRKPIEPDRLAILVPRYLHQGFARSPS